MRPRATTRAAAGDGGSHVFALGVGSAETRPSSARLPADVSDFDQLPPSDFEEADREFEARVGPSAGGRDWVLPPPGGQGTRTAVTDADGVATFQWRPDDATASSGVVVEDRPRPGDEPDGWEGRIGGTGAAGDPRVRPGVRLHRDATG